MTRRKPYLVSGQELLFELPEPQDEGAQTPPELTPEETMRLLGPAYGVEGSYVSVEDRARLLLTALESFSARNSRKGFALAAFTAPSSKKIWSEYEENTERVLKGARNNRFLFEALAKRSFWQATGFRALKWTGLVRPRQVDPRAEKMWDDFYYLYSHPKTRKERNLYINQLKELIPPEDPEEQGATELAA